MSRRQFAFASVALAVLVAVPLAAHADTVYVPWPGADALGISGYTPEIAVAGTGAAASSYKTFLIPTNVDGVALTRTAQSGAVSTNHTAILNLDAAFRGMVELQAPSAVEVSARLANGSTMVHVPVVGSGEAKAGGSRIDLLGLERTSTSTSMLTVINLGTKSSLCSVTYYAADGTSLATGSATLLPLSHALVTNVLNGAGDPTGITDVRAAVTCAESFFAYAYVTDSTSGRISYVGPATDAQASTLTAPGSTAPSACPTGATCVSQAGVLFKATENDAYGRVQLPAPAGAWRRGRMQVDIKFGSFFNNTAKQMAYWFVINGNKRMLGTLLLRGPVGNDVILIHGYNVPHEGKTRIRSTHHMVAGTTYHIVNDYDAGNRRLTVTVTDKATGQLVDQFSGPTNVSSFTIAAGDMWTIDMGGLPPEFTKSVGTEWSNVQFEAYP